MEKHHKFFCLKNTRLDRVLMHPSTGSMYIADKLTADDMLVACHQHLVASGLGHMVDDFVVEEADAQVQKV